MENKNFEKKRMSVKNSDNQDGFVAGYNTCLDRTNAKGIYEAGEKLTELLQELFEDGFPKRSPLHKAFLELQTELKKAQKDN